MGVQWIYRAAYPYFRGKRLDRFARGFPLRPETTILDVGGCVTYWQYRQLAAQITVLNLPSYVPPADMRGCKVLRGDGTALDFADGSFDVAHSNSVIEHLSAWERQVAFARGLRRVGRGVWVQTPAKCFPVECHTIDPVVHYLPVHWQRRLLRHGTLWGLLTRPTPEQIEDFLATTRLLTYREMQELFPDCQILVEKFAGITKSYIAYRPLSVASPAAECSANTRRDREFAAHQNRPATLPA
jgi:hypothetical protein